MLVAPFPSHYLAIKSEDLYQLLKFSIHKKQNIAFLHPSSFVLLPPLFSFAGHFIQAFILKGNFFRKTFRIIGLDGLGSAAGK